MIDRVGTNAQTQLYLAQVMKAGNALDQSEAQVSSGKVSATYGGIGNRTAVLEAARSAANRSSAYQANIQLALDQSNLQDTQLTSLSNLANDLRQALTKALADGDASTLMTQAGSIYQQVTQILNSKDANGNYLYGGDRNDVPPVTPATLADLAALPSAANAFANGTVAATVRVGDGQSVQVGMLASDIGTSILSTLKDIADFNNGASGPFGSTISAAQSGFLTTEIGTAANAATDINNAAASNGYVNKQLQDASDQQQSLNTLYTGFVSDIEDVDMGQAVEKLNQNQIALQAALQVTSKLNQLSLLNYLPAS